MFFIDTETLEYPITEGAIRTLFPSTSFPNPFKPPLPYAAVASSIQPERDYRTQGVREIAPAFIDGTWTQQWEIYDLTQEEIDNIVNRQAGEVRSVRNQMLAETDWRFRSDLNPSQEWIGYCQALRDLPAQPNFPWEINWPAKPEN